MTSDLERIELAVAHEFGLPLSRLHTRDTHWSVCVPRQIAIALQHRLVCSNQSALARHWGMTQPSIHHALRVVAALQATNRGLATRIDALSATLRLVLDGAPDPARLRRARPVAA